MRPSDGAAPVDPSTNYGRQAGGATGSQTKRKGPTNMVSHNRSDRKDSALSSRRYLHDRRNTSHPVDCTSPPSVGYGMRERLIDVLALVIVLGAVVLLVLNRQADVATVSASGGFVVVVYRIYRHRP